MLNLVPVLEPVASVAVRAGRIEQNPVERVDVEGVVDDLATPGAQARGERADQSRATSFLSAPDL
jgi:hypothetical protein